MKQGVLNYDPGEKISGVSELELTADVASRVDILICGLQAVVDLNTCSLVVLNTCCFKVQASHVWCAADSYQHFFDNDFVFSFILFVDNCGQRATLLQSTCFCVQLKADTIAGHSILNDTGCIRIFTGKDMIGHFDLCDVTPQSGKALCHFTAERAASNDGKAFRQLCQRKHCLVCQCATLLNAGNRQAGSLRPGTDYSSAVLQFLVTDGHRTLVGKLGGPLINVDSKICKSGD